MGQSYSTLLSEQERSDSTEDFSTLREKHAELLVVINDMYNAFNTNNEGTETLFDEITTETIALLKDYVDNDMDETFDKTLARVENLMLRDDNVEAGVGCFAKTKQGSTSVCKTFNIIICCALFIIMACLFYLFSLKPEVFLVLAFSLAAAALIGWIKMTW